jgi:uncharacterized protein (TIGR03790 family)
MKLPAHFFALCRSIAFVLLLCGRLAAQAPPAPEPRPDGLQLRGLAEEPKTDAAATAVVYNFDDQESELLAKFYAEKRGIPADQLIGLHCSTEEEISRADYDRTIAEPLRAAFTVNSWWKLRDADHALGPVEQNRIRFVAIMRGVPLKIAAAKGYAGDKVTDGNPLGTHNEAAVDSELATLSLRTRAISGAVNNPYYKSLSTIRDARRPEVMLVCRLDGPTPAVVRRMIVDGLAAEQTGLRGFTYVDARGIDEHGLKEGDDWLYAVADDARKHGFPVILDNGPGMFPENYPMRYPAQYFGWYSEKLAGPFARPGFRFLPGAIAVHIHSFSAVTIRDTKSNWVGPLLDLGAAATLGNVYEPYLTLTPHLDIFQQRLRLGFTFGEAAYMSQRVLSWMTTFVGDPLYRPFPPVPEVTDSKTTEEWEAYRRGAVVWFRDPAAGRKALQESARELKSGIIWEALGLLEMGGTDRQQALDALAQARKTYTTPADIIRVVIHEVIQLRAAGRENDAVQLARRTAKAHSAIPALSVLKMVVPAAFGG